MVLFRSLEDVQRDGPSRIGGVLISDMMTMFMPCQEEQPVQPLTINNNPGNSDVSVDNEGLLSQVLVNQRTSSRNIFRPSSPTRPNYFNDLPVSPVVIN